jgi:hypothetical protein
MTHRQYRIWHHWIGEQWNNPSRSDHYLMLIALQVLKTPARVWGKEPSHNLEDMRIPFSVTQGSKIVEKPEEAAHGPLVPGSPELRLPRRVRKEDMTRYQSALGRATWMLGLIGQEGEAS